LEEGSLEICPNLPNFIVETRSTRHRTAHFLHIPWTAPGTAESQYQTTKQNLPQEQAAPAMPKDPETDGSATLAKS